MRDLETIRIRGFKSIRDVTVDLQAINILIGANGSGKSNFIEVFRLLNEILERRLQVYTGVHGTNNLLYYGNSATDEISIDLNFGANAYQISLIPSTHETLFFSKELLLFHDTTKYEAPYERSLGTGHQETKLFEESAANPYRKVIADYVIARLKKWKVYHFHDTSATSKLKQSQLIDDNFQFHPDASNLAPFLYRLKATQPSHYQEIVQTIRRVAPFFDDFVLEPSPLNPDMIRLLWRDKRSDMIFNPHSLSDGTLRFICLVTLLLQPELPSLILLDEPELGLHPFAMTILAGLIQSISEQSQIILSTQSSSFINQFTPEDILVVERQDGQSQFKRLDSSELAGWLESYESLGELWEMNVLGGRPQEERF